MNPSTATPTPRIAITLGEPAGIGPDIVARICAEAWPVELIVVGDAGLLRERARLGGIKLDVHDFAADATARPSVAGRVLAIDSELASECTPGVLNRSNSAGVVATLERACDGCIAGEFAAMVTAPVHKGIINDAGIPFSGHTEFLAERAGADLPVMLLVAGDLRVALVTTHLALRDVADAIKPDRVRDTIGVLHDGLRKWFGLPDPRITVLGLNPHAGESGHLGTEELEIIEPVMSEMRADGLTLLGPLPADTAFTRHSLEQTDAVLAMYHDQGLPVLKHSGFGRAVNVTLGLPIIRTSVDHGTALDLAGTNRSDTGSLRTALELAIDMQAHAAT
ncbi:MAG: 4-hydroxythreonine-4-phosphate dehydrogenase PdxA [Gammaproteobacteria bacterium]